MKLPDIIPAKVVNHTTLLQRVAGWKMLGKKIAFTNGVFDLLHAGHVHSLTRAAAEANFLIVAVNADESVKRLKGKNRPVQNEWDRAFILASLLVVDAVIIFNEDTPLELIKAVMPDVLVKGGDYTIENVVGAQEVIASGGRVVINPVLEGYSTTKTIESLKRQHDLS